MTNNSTKNILTSLASSATTILANFITQRIFLSTLGLEYLGLNGIFSNIISMLSIIDLGLGSAIIYNLYRPLARNDVETIKSLMRFYQKAYRYIGLAVCGIGLLLLPFLNLIIPDAPAGVNLHLAFLLAVLDAACSYFLSFRRSILYADQKNYLINLAHVVYTVGLNFASVAILVLAKNFYLYLIVRVIARLLENLFLHRLSAQKYPYLLARSVKPLKKSLQKDIFQKIRALFFHKIGTFIVLGTDNIIISIFLGLSTVGLYSGYLSIISALTIVVQQAISALTPSVGHLLIAEDHQRNYQAFRKIRHLGFLVSASTALCLYALATPFITLWLGADYLLPSSVLFILTFNYFQQTMRAPYSTFKEAAGIYHEDRFVPLAESAINILASVVLVQLLGLPGVFIGTAISSLALWSFSYPRFVFSSCSRRVRSTDS